MEPVQRYPVVLVTNRQKVIVIAREVLYDEWFDDGLEARLASVKGANPVFLPEPSLEPVYHYSPIILDPDSPDKRWVTLIQWHSHQDGTDKLSVSGRQLPDE